MAKTTRSKKDINVIALSIMEQVTGQKKAQQEQVEAALNNDELRKQLMREMGRRGGKKGGKARAKALTAAQRSKIAKNAARLRWQKKHD